MDPSGQILVVGTSQNQPFVAHRSPTGTCTSTTLSLSGGATGGGFNGVAWNTVPAAWAVGAQFESDSTLKT